MWFMKIEFCVVYFAFIVKSGRLENARGGVRVHCKQVNMV